MDAHECCSETELVVQIRTLVRVYCELEVTGNLNLQYLYHCELTYRSHVPAVPEQELKAMRVIGLNGLTYIN